jgi:hypothetical protein
MGMSGTEQKNHKTALAALDAKLTAAMDTMEERFARTIEDVAVALDDRVKAEALDRARSLKHAADSLAIHATLIESLLKYRLAMMSLGFWGRLRWLVTGRVFDGRLALAAQRMSANKWERAALDAQQAAEEDTPVTVECRRVAAELAARAVEADAVMSKFKAVTGPGKGDGQC